MTFIATGFSSGGGHSGDTFLAKNGTFLPISGIIPKIVLPSFLTPIWLESPVLVGWGNGAENGSRTRDLRITSALLYQLSYLGDS